MASEQEWQLTEEWIQKALQDCLNSDDANEELKVVFTVTTLVALLDQFGQSG